ncbi:MULTISPECIES: AbrB/MazE/SpoVT family DNA-binding domain-containing protein [Pseudoxanthomonas]|jgi:putative addiction module antidote|uniref:AbrB/MazE/SpoVT family DNA-binding domain-containing protein n=1 Tax=Pseudoxanthomonas TaxID=83618 RepID=UPI0011422881|nr:MULTISPECIES: AbrB/MazE/SpoVT family DNA-binding domain-containing protein [Pseudoxanthomonas]MCL6713463.1 AbrB/MazE/SpoVT family DNA-binding domain-containing protein [Pseudomonas sp. R2.Fl]UBB25659.1 AbrB/MazE/SpoVT family DNA-binding domain-containing protein [Pseudoxanthomonas japonensis]MBB3276807.1 putative addiction module antidote [Pseudoxanthomonas sp. OG2]MBD9378880.1 AbrB/MazE/SpoVT family DNA-binding domain-containing protein [Pseudoxanthomonas sp. PXM04]MBV7475975.1 AbrB/MazE/S
MKTLKLNRIGNSVGLVLPRDVLSRLKVAEGDTLYLTEAPDGYRLTPFDPEFARQMDAAEQIMRENRDVLRKLAE